MAAYVAVEMNVEAVVASDIDGCTCVVEDCLSVSGERTATKRD